ncbi:MAG: TIGR02300 family protein [Pseudomonadota bacterium]|nr:TIGR02300 family protein [Pseudomonadota bacterium]
MVAKDLGTKLICQSCEAKFYDFNKKKPTCPVCETEFVPVKPRTRKSTTKVDKSLEVANTDKVEKNNIIDSPPEIAADSNKVELSEDSLDDIEIPEVEDVEEDNSTLMEDTSDMGDDNNDIAGVIVSNDNSNEVV